MTNRFTTQQEPWELDLGVDPQSENPLDNILRIDAQDLANQAAFVQDQANWQGLFEKWAQRSPVGIPTTGRNPYQRWLASQWQTPAADYTFRQSGLMGTDPATGMPDVGRRSFQDYLTNRYAGRAPGMETARPWTQMGSGYLKALLAMEPQAQREFLSDLPPGMADAAIYGAFAETSPRFIAQRRAARALDPALRRRFDISEEGMAGGSFLQFLRDRFNIGGTPTVVADTED
jgi:hypothetical protein